MDIALRTGRWPEIFIYRHSGIRRANGSTGTCTVGNSFWQGKGGQLRSFASLLQQHIGRQTHYFKSAVTKERWGDPQLQICHDKKRVEVSASDFNLMPSHHIMSTDLLLRPNNTVQQITDRYCVYSHRSTRSLEVLLSVIWYHNAWIINKLVPLTHSGDFFFKVYFQTHLSDQYSSH